MVKGYIFHFARNANTICKVTMSSFQLAPCLISNKFEKVILLELQMMIDVSKSSFRITFWELLSVIPNNVKLHTYVIIRLLVHMCSPTKM